MKVILLEPLENLGDVGQVVDVKPGYARNYLLPRGLAVLATESNLKALEARIRAQAKRLAERKAEAERLKEILEKGLSVRQAEALRERLAMAPKRSAEPSPLSLELSRHLGLPVRVVGGKKGKVVIQYRSLEELEALLRRLGYQA